MQYDKWTKAHNIVNILRRRYGRLNCGASGTTCNADLACGHHQKLAALKIISVFYKHGIELIDLGLEFCSWEPKENDASVG